MQSGIKITGLKVFGVSLTPNSDRPYVFVKIETNQGLVGWGEGTLEGKAGAVIACVNDFKDFLIGSDPMQVEHIWQDMYVHSFYRAGPVMGSAISGIDQASVGHSRESTWECLCISCSAALTILGEYAVITTSTEPADSCSRFAQTAKEQGITCVKSGIPGYYEWLERLPKIDRAIKTDSAVSGKPSVPISISRSTSTPKPAPVWPRSL